MPDEIVYTTMTSPIGELLLTARNGALTGVYLTPHKGRPELGREWQRDDDALAPVRAQLDEYFAGTRTSFDVPTGADGTEFQRRVWEELARIPYGETITYAELARRVGNPAAARAVGMANGRNPISIVVPCHRVIGADGKPRGYAGGADRKTWLLDLERNAAGATASPA